MPLCFPFFEFFSFFQLFPVFFSFFTSSNLKILGKIVLGNVSIRKKTIKSEDLSTNEQFMKKTEKNWKKLKKLEKIQNIEKHIGILYFSALPQIPLYSSIFRIFQHISTFFHFLHFFSVFFHKLEICGQNLQISSFFSYGKMTQNNFP